MTWPPGRSARHAGWTYSSVFDQVRETPRSAEERFEQAWSHAARHLATEFETAAVLDHQRLRLHAARGLIGAGIDGGVADIDRVVDLIETRGLILRGEQVSLVKAEKEGRLKVTNSAQIRIEESLAKEAARASGDRSGALSEEALTRAIEQSGLDFDNEHGRNQKAAIYALGKGGRLSLLTGVAGSGKTTLLRPLVSAWREDRQLDPGGRDVIGLAAAWRQADALGEAGIHHRFALAPFLDQVERGEVEVTANTVMVIDEIGQIAPRQMLRLLELQRLTGATVKGLGDGEQAQAIEAGSAIEILQRVLDREDMPELLTTVRQKTARDRLVAGLFRGEKPTGAQLDAYRPKGGEAAGMTREDADLDPRNRFHFEEVRRAIDMKREDNTIRLVGGDHDQVLRQTAELYVTRRDALRASGAKGGITMTALTNQDAADLSQAVREILVRRGEIDRQGIAVAAVDQRGEAFDMQVARGDRIRLFRRMWGTVEGQGATVGNNGDIVDVLGHSEAGLTIRTKDGREAAIEWKRFRDAKTGRMLMGLGHAMTVDAAQGITSEEHINAMPRGVGTATGFTSYVAESRAKGTTWTMISDAATFEAVRSGRALGDQTEITSDDLWNHVARGMSEKPYKALGMDLLLPNAEARDRHVRELIHLGRLQERAEASGEDLGGEIRRQVQARTLEKTAGAGLETLDRRIRSLLEANRAAMSQEELDLRLRRAAMVRPTTDRSASPGM